eukprot:CAMPEP_0170968950 /NCGR_PEP_ID=MMETSP0735-20130129/43647_1 /TAXON_ID=186038 /ORGANISM="Fragilariopsis kerguelensis, Strain L26-C5" /LENGTH=837 /DNA_ID=CAMNT_0011388245 /DNA_START=32 /DNA_END=2547 /DNA_ORIENTATION=+
MFESEETSMAVDPVLTSTSTNTKSKKKRNRKKKKKGATASTASSVNTIDDDVSFDGGFATITNKTKKNRKKQQYFDAKEILRNQLIERDRYEPTRIDKAMGEMWDKGLQYDEFNAVLDYLESCDSRRSDVIINVGVKSDVDVDIDGRNNIKEGDTKVPEPESSSPSQQSDGGGSDKDKEKDNNNCDVINTFKNSEEKNIEVDDVDDHDEDEEEEESQQAKSPTTMTAKLDMVAGFENLTDAIFALTQWVNKAAKLEEIEDLCRAEKTSALSTIVRRGISTEVTDQTKFETFVQPGLFGLLVSVLNRCGVEFDDGERMENMLKQARKVSLMGAGEDEFEEDADIDVADRVATFIVSRIAMAMEEMKEFNNNKIMVGDVHIEDNDIEDDDALMTLTCLRDKSKVNAKQACVTVRFAMEQLLNNKDRFDEEKAQLEELKSRILQDESEKVRDLRSSMETLETERSTVQEKIAEVKLSLKKLEAQNEDTIFQIEVLEGDIEKEQRNDNAQAKLLEKQVRAAKEAVKYGNVVGSLASMMKSYGKSLKKATISKLIQHPMTSVGRNNNKDCNSDTGPDVKASAAMDDYLRQVRASTADFIKMNEIAALKLELAQCAGLGMNTTIGQINQSLTSTEKLIDFYSRKLAVLIEDGRSMYNELITRLETYEAAVTSKTGQSKETGGNNSDSQASGGLVKFSPTNLLRDVPAAIKALKIPNCDRLERFVLESSTKEPAQSGGDADSINGESSNNDRGESAQSSLLSTHRLSPAVVPSYAQSSLLATHRLSPAVVPSSVSATATSLPEASAPVKFTWASAAKTKVNSSTTPKQSLLDIQKQELKSRIGS